MKKTITLSFLLLFGTLLQAQITRNTVISIGNKHRNLTGFIQPLSDNQTFSLKIPEELHFYSKEKYSRAAARNPLLGSQPGGFHNSLQRNPRGMSAKLDNRNPADFQFTIITEGIENLDPKIVNINNNSKVVEYTYTFPVKMELRNKEGVLLKTFILSSENEIHKITVAPNFLEDVKVASAGSNTGGQQATGAPTTFSSTSNEKILEWIEKNEEQILVRMEFDALRKISIFAGEVIASGYGFPSMSGNPMIVGLDKKDISKFPELNNAIEKLKSEVQQVFSREPISRDLAEQLMKSGDFFASQYTSESTRPMLQLCATNAGIAYLLAGNTEKALPHLQAAHSALPLLRGSQVDAMFYQVAFMNQFRNAPNTITVVPLIYLADYKNYQNNQ